VWYYESVAITSSSVKFRPENFDGSINFGSWNFEVMDMLVQAGLQKVLIGTCTLINTDVRCVVILCHWLKSFLPTWKLHQLFSI
jgi:hypothetical protein